MYLGKFYKCFKCAVCGSSAGNYVIAFNYDHSEAFCRECVLFDLSNYITFVTCFPSYYCYFACNLNLFIFLN